MLTSPAENEAIRSVRQPAHECCAEPIRHLAHQQDQPRVVVVKIKHLKSIFKRFIPFKSLQPATTRESSVTHLMEVEEEVGEPHGGAQIIEDMSETIAKLLPEPEAGHSAIVCINIVRLVTLVT